MNEYELLYVISPRLSAEDVEGAVERMGTLIESVGGSISMVDNWGRRRLAYPIRHHFEGTYVLTHLNLPGERAAEFERALNLNEDILRHLMIGGVIPGYEGPPEQEADMRRPQARDPFRERPPLDPTGDAAPAPDGEAPAAAAEEAPAADAPAPEAATAAEPASGAASAEAPVADAPAPEAATADAPAPASAPATAEAPTSEEPPAEAESAEAPPAAVAGVE